MKIGDRVRWVKNHVGSDSNPGNMILEIVEDLNEPPFKEPKWRLKVVDLNGSTYRPRRTGVVLYESQLKLIETEITVSKKIILDF